MTSEVVVRRRWFRLSLRSGFILLTLISCVLAWIANERRQLEYERRVTEKYRATWGGFLQSRVYALTVQSEIDLTTLSNLSRIRGLYIEGPWHVSLKGIEQLETLRVLDIRVWAVSDMPRLAGLTNLEELFLYSVGPSVNDLTPLSGLRNLKRLTLMGCAVSKPQVEALQESLPNCDIDFAGDYSPSS